MKKDLDYISLSVCEAKHENYLICSCTSQIRQDISIFSLEMPSRLALGFLSPLFPFNTTSCTLMVSYQESYFCKPTF